MPGLNPRIAAIVRTQGTRPEELARALESLGHQVAPCLAVVVVHAEQAAFDQVKARCGDSAAVVHAGDLKKKRGYPINRGLQYLCEQAPEIEYAFLLDDDDIVYPFFSSEVLASFATSGADVVYTGSNRKMEGYEPEPGFELRPSLHLLLENFIPTNSFAFRLKTLRERGVWADEEIEYLEDWRLLIAFLEKGFRFQQNPATLCEFFLDTDPRQERKLESPGWRAAAAEIRRQINHAQFPVAGGEIAEMMRGFKEAPKAAAPASPLVVSRLERRIADLESSWSWRLTGPVRAIGGAWLRLRSRIPGGGKS